MNISAFQITASRNIPIETRAKTLDEMTRALPQGFYTTFSTLAQGTKAMGLHTHLQRLYVPAVQQGLIPSVDAQILRTRIAALAKIYLPKESRIRLILTKNNGMIYIAVQPFESLSKQIYDNGINVITTEMARQAPRVKDTGFISASVDQRGQVRGNVFEVLLTKNGKILEGMTSNFYAVQGRTLITARYGILLGVTRRAVLRLARGQGLSIEYRAPRMNEKINEAFLTSSSRGVVPIVSIDDKPVGQGGVGKWSEILSKAYQAYVEARSESFIEH
jgi:branched-chain amino acid aminotransferase